MYKALKSALKACGVPVFHLEAAKAEKRYIVWREVREKTLRANGKVALRLHVIAVDFFTKDEYDELPNKIEVAIDSIGAAHDDVEIDYEPDTGYIHYSWTCEVENGYD